jgi:hypothetical protein
MIGIGANIVALAIGYYYLKNVGFLNPQKDGSAQAIE